MGFDEGRIILDSPNGAYYPGQTVGGRLEFDLEKIKKFRGIYIDLKGFCKVHWTTSHTRRHNDRQETYTVSHDSYEEYLNNRIYLAGGKEGDHQLQPGRHVLSFECRLPVSCPSSFEGAHGHIRYEVKAVVDRAFKFDQEKMAAIRIVAPVDLNLHAICSEPIEMNITNSYCCWCISSGTSETLVKLPVSGYCPGQVIPIEVSCTNRSNVGIDKIKFCIKREISFHAEQNPDNRMVEDKIAEIKSGSVPGNNNRNWTIELEIPAVDVYNFDNCRHIDVNYYFKVEVETESCHEDGEDSRRIMIGNIPLRGFQDNVENPMKDQMPQQPYIPQNIQGVTSYPVVNQPLPTNTPYPTPNYPYPGQPQNPQPGSFGPNQNPYGGPFGPNMPYPGSTNANQTLHPNIGQNYGGSTNNIPNAGQMPYPGSPNYGGSTNNMTNVGQVPYPGAPNIGPYTNPYGGSNHNIPNAGQMPYPGSPNVPGMLNPNMGPNAYGGSANNLPNVGPNQSPYNRGPSPVPYPNASAGLKTGTVGFTVQTNVKSSDEASVPLLPPGAGIPYPRSNSPNPYTSASAPEPSTPDKEEKSASKDNDGSNPNAPYPYNPNYHEPSPKEKDDKQ